MFAGVLFRASATVNNIGAPMWAMDPAVQTVDNTVGMPDYVLDAVRSIQGENYAVPCIPEARWSSSAMAVVRKNRIPSFTRRSFRANIRGEGRPARLCVGPDGRRVFDDVSGWLAPWA